MASESTTGPSGRGDLRSDPAFQKVFIEYLDEINLRGFVDPDRVLQEQPKLGPAILEELEAYVQLRGEEKAEAKLGALGDYVLRRQIGRGGMGVVYEAWENSMDRRVALKVLPVGAAADDKAFHRFMREARTAGKLSHPNVVPVYGVGIKEKTPYYAMEYIEGETLAQLLERLRAPERKDAERSTVELEVSRLFRDVQVDTESDPEARPVAGRSPAGTAETDLEHYTRLAQAFAGVADGLQHAHSRGIVHRDIKPSNLILDREGRLRILDFGLARLEGQESLTVSGDLLGTVLYMSPEQAMARRIPIDYRTDVYSLGATMYEMLAWKPPFRGKSHQDTLSQIIFRDPEPLRRSNPRVPRDLETIVLKCLRKEPAERYGTAEALGQDLRRFARGNPIEARPEGRWKSTTRRLWRWRVRLSLALAVLAVVGIGALFLQAKAERELAQGEAAYRQLVLSAVEELPLERLESLSGSGSVASEIREEQALVETFRVSDRRQDAERIRRAASLLEQAKALFPNRPQARYHLGRANRLLEEPVEAEDSLDDLLGEQAPTWRASEAALAGGDWRRALDGFDGLTRALGENGEPFLGASLEILVSRGIARLELGDLEGAKRDFLASSLRWPGASLPAVMLARAYLREDKRPAAERWLEERFALIEDPARRDAFAFKAFRLLAQAGVRDTLLAWVERMQPARNRDLATMQAILWREREGEIRSARQVLEIGTRLLESGPDDAVVHALMAIAASDSLGGDDLKRRHLDRARELGGDDPHVLTLVAALLPSKEAIDLCQRVLGSHPGFVPAQVEIAARNAFLDPDAAIEVLEELLARGRDLAWLHFYLGLANFNKGLHDQAEEHYRKAIELSPRWSFPHIRKAQLHWGRWELEKVEQEYLSLIEISQPHPERWTLWMLATLYFKMGRPDDALHRFCQAFPRSPVSVSVHMWTFQRLFIEEPRLKRFEPLDQFVVDFEPQVAALGNDPWILQTMALALAYAPKKTDLPRALLLMERAVKITKGRDARFLASLAAIRLRAPDPVHALKALEAAPGQRLYDCAHDAMLREVRQSLLPRVFSPASIEAAIFDGSFPEGLVPQSIDGTEVPGQRARRYLRATILERAGQFDAAAEEFGALVEPDEDGKLAFRRRIACFRAAHRFEQAAEETIAAISQPELADRTCWDLWWETEHQVLGKDPEQLLRDLPDEATEQAALAGHRSDLQWLLETLVRGERLRIDCGAEEDHLSPSGVRWSRDRFFIGGWKHTGAENDVGPLQQERPESLVSRALITGAAYDRPYREARQFPRRLPDDGYRIPLPSGKYRVTLHFAEVRPHFTPRRFEISLEGTRTLSKDQPLHGKLGVVEHREQVVNVDDGALDLRIDPLDGVPVLSALEIERERE